MEGPDVSQLNDPPLDVASSNYRADPAPSSSSTGQGDTRVGSTYHLKWIPWNSGRIPIVMQSMNGPCPLIAIMNVSLLREKIILPDLLEQITASQLLTYLGECLMDSIPTGPLEGENGALLNIEQNIHDAIEVLPKLETGLDVNIRFTGIADFEYTQEYVIFDLLRIPLYHGWLSDPSLEELQNSIGKRSYNQLVDSIIEGKNSNDPETSARILIVEEFLERTASQLTQHGLDELRSKIKDNEIGVLFRNNHFLTLLKRDGEIYTLVTDHGYLTEDNVIWEILDNIEGAGRYFNAHFEPSDLRPKSDQAIVACWKKNDVADKSFVPTKETEQYDLLVNQITESLASEMKDHELAKRLQAEEEEAYDKMLRENYADDLRDSAQEAPIGHFNADDYPPLCPKEQNDSVRDRNSKLRSNKAWNSLNANLKDEATATSHDQTAELAPNSQTEMFNPGGCAAPIATPALGGQSSGTDVPHRIHPTTKDVDNKFTENAKASPALGYRNNVDLPPQTAINQIGLSRQPAISTHSNEQQQRHHQYPQQRSKQDKSTKETNCIVS